MGTGNGLCCLKIDSSRNASFTNYYNNPNDINSLSSNHIRSSYLDKDGYLWLGTYKGELNKFDPQTGIFVSYKHDPNNPNSISKGKIKAIY